MYFLQATMDKKRYIREDNERIGNRIKTIRKPKTLN